MIFNQFKTIVNKTEKAFSLIGCKMNDKIYSLSNWAQYLTKRGGKSLGQPLLSSHLASYFSPMPLPISILEIVINDNDNTMTTETITNFETALPAFTRSLKRGYRSPR